MTNKEIARKFQYLGDIMELHGENTFKIKSYQNVYLTLRKLPNPLSEMSRDEIEAIKGVGKAISDKIQELLRTGEMATLKKYEEQTPEGVREMLRIPGFGPKKIGVIWKELGIEVVGELLYACNENRLIELKGFGQKTQEDLRQKLEYFQKSQGKFLYADLETSAIQVRDAIASRLPDAKISFAGAFRRLNNIVEKLELVVGYDGSIELLFQDDFLILDEKQGHTCFCHTSGEIPVIIYHCDVTEFGSKLFRYSAGDAFMQAFLAKNQDLDFRGLATEEEVFARASMNVLPPELREQAWSINWAEKGGVSSLIELSDIKGVIHAHSTYSDGLHTIEEMALQCRSLGYRYLGVSDHSKSAFYANGLKEEQLLAQWAEIDSLNKKLSPFRIFKGIESDILSDGSLDYPDELLKQFDFIIASVHSNLRMDEAKATARILRAIENPHTTILGHPTGRLLLSRPGYPLDHRKIIEACAANGVAIELNANPYRLDLDWSWIPLALEKNVMISINPDAHSTGGIRDIHYGVLSARKGGLTATHCLTALEIAGFQDFIKNKKN
jgi:DNA polymerase (family 10)